MGRYLQEIFWNMGWFVSESAAIGIFCGAVILLLIIVLLVMRTMRNSRKIKEMEQQAKDESKARMKARLERIAVPRSDESDNQ